MARGAGEVHLDPATVEAVHPVQQDAQTRRAFDDIAQTHGFSAPPYSHHRVLQNPRAAYSRAVAAGKAAGRERVTVLYEVCRDGRGGGGLKGPARLPGDDPGNARRPDTERSPIP
ncbi:hypothetical protein GCM10009639_02520 [Kitasatospora putterlickiae]|uniref:Uncharacterized protein n=1 Tax=Kitasatospora putterlickiae TaxID=221725 RepID=A0ABP4IAZ8_9ACTN